MRKLNEIPKSQFRKGLELSERNAKKLISEAEKLDENGFHRAAFILGYTAYEEVSKALLFLDNWEKETISKQTWKDFKDHIIKIKKGYEEVTIYFHEHFLIHLHPNSLPVIDPEYSINAFRRRNAALFVNYNFDINKWESPNDVSSKLSSWASEMIFSAKQAMTKLQDVKIDIIEKA